MQAGTSAPTDISKVRGRKDNTGQEAAIKMVPFKEGIEALVASYTAYQEVKEQFSDGCKAIAEKTGLHTATVRRVVVAKASDNFAEASAKAQQMSLAFEEMAA